VAGVSRSARPSAIPIVALDVPSLERALALVERLGVACRFYKVGMELFTAAGADVVRRIRDAGAEVFLDLKYHDIPNTVRGGVRSAAELGASLVTVHASGGRAMLEAAVEGAGQAGSRAASGGCTVLAVSVLTSMDSAALGEAWGRDGVRAADEVLRLASLARSAGVPGLVCSGEEAARVHAAHGDALALLVPGIRLAGGDRHDQTRVVTPAEAQTRGARWIILGRAVTGAADPLDALARVEAELAAG
jgi:orotidine-5'-phosphate decarboxylase